MAKRPDIPFTDIARAALSSASTLVSRWLPGGKEAGSEYKVANPLRADNKVGSFSINVGSGANGGKWADFATNDAGNDLISLYAYLEGIEQWESAIDVADQVGFTLPDGCRPDSKPVAERKKPIVDPDSIKSVKHKEESPWHPVYPSPVPTNAVEPPKAHVKRGLPQATWCYRNAAGEVLGYIYRFTTSDGGKETIPLNYCKNALTGQFDWRWMQWPEPRPLYGLDKLAANPDAWVLLVEGEKCADAPLELLPKAVVVTWSGGSKAVDKQDWTALAGRNIYAWADCDAQRQKLTKAEADQGVEADSKPLLSENEQPGIKAMLQIRDKLLALNPATKFLMVDIPKPNIVPSGWDIADAIASGWDAARLREFILKTRDYSLGVLPIAEIKKQVAPKSATAMGDSSWRVLLMLSDKGKVIDCRENVFIYLNHHPLMAGLVAYDKFAIRIVKRRPAPWDVDFEGDAPWEDNDSLEFGLWLSQNEDIAIRSMENINLAVKLAASRNAYDPLVDYLDSLVWDGHSRVNYWLTDFVGIERSEYSSLCGRLFLISMIARAYKPGCIMRAMPVFEGAQFRGKSSIARILGGRWFSDSPLDLKGKDGFINIQGTWLHEIAELGSFNNQEAPIIKAYLSSASDRFRSPFDKYARDYPRRTVFFGTTNEDIYLRDKTGNSRFWPLKTEGIGDIDLDGLALSRDQLFAEAVHLFNQGERWHPLADEQQRLFEPEQSLRLYDDPWREAIIQWLNASTFSSTSVSDVLSDCLKVEISKQTSAMGVTVGKTLTSLRWVKKRPGAKEGMTRKEFYYRPNEVKVIEDFGDENDLPF